MPLDEDKQLEVQRVLDDVLPARVAPSKVPLFRGVVNLHVGPKCAVTVRLLKARDPYHFLIRVLDPISGRSGSVDVGRRTVADALTNLHRRQEAERQDAAAEAARKEGTIAKSVFRDGGRRRFDPEISPAAKRRLRRAAEAGERARVQRRRAAQQRKRQQRREAASRATAARKAVEKAQGVSDAPVTTGQVARMRAPRRTAPVRATQRKLYKGGKALAAPRGARGKHFRFVGGEWGGRASPERHVSTPGLGDDFREDPATVERRRKWLEMSDGEEEYVTPRPRDTSLVYTRTEYPVLPADINAEDLRVFCREFVMAHPVPDKPAALRVVLSSETFDGDYTFAMSGSSGARKKRAVEARRSTSCLSHNPITDGLQCSCPFCIEMQAALRPRHYPPRTPSPEPPPKTPPPKLPELTRPVRSWYLPEEPVPRWEQWREDVRARRTGGDRWEVTRFDRSLPQVPEQKARLLPDDNVLYEYLLDHQPTMRRLRDSVKGPVEWVRVRSPEGVGVVL